MTERITAGAASLKAASDLSTYDPLELGYAMSEDVANQLKICAEKHEKIFDEEEFCLVLVRASDCLIQGVMRQKFYAYLYLPQPRPEQSVYLYNKRTKQCRRLWSLPNAKNMAILSETPSVRDEWRATKYWCDAFFSGKFFERIRSLYGIKMPSEAEFLKANREKLIKSGCKQVKRRGADALDLGDVQSDKIVGSIKPSSEERVLETLRKAQSLDRDVSSHKLH